MRRDLVATGFLLLLVGFTAFLQTSIIEDFESCPRPQVVEMTLQPKSERRLRFGIGDTKTIIEIEVTVQRKAVVKIRSLEKSIYKREVNPGKHSWNVTLGERDGRYNLTIENPGRSKLDVLLRLRFFVLVMDRVRPHVDASLPIILIGVSTVFAGLAAPSSNAILLSSTFCLLSTASYLHLVGFFFGVPLFFLSSLVTFVFANILCLKLLFRWIRPQVSKLHWMEFSFVVGILLSIQALLATLVIPLYVGRTGLVAEREIPSQIDEGNLFLGVCDHFEASTDENVIRNHFRLTRSLGAEWVRLDMSWEEIEPTRDAWSFDFWDSLVRVSSSYNLRILPVISRTPRWASSRPDSESYYTYPPRDLADYDDFIRKVVERYGRKMYYWEIWNEPDAQYWRGSASEYFQLLEATRSALKTADPAAKLVLGGISPKGSQFLEELVLFGALDIVDAVGLHLYGQSYNAVLHSFHFLLGIMERSGTAKPVWITELGSPTPLGYGAEEHQADFLERTITALSSVSRVQKIFWYELKDSGLIYLWPEHNFGLVKFDLTPKASYKAYLRVAESVRSDGEDETRKT